MRIPNKVLASIVFVGGIAFFYLVYLYFFVYFTSSLTLESNVEDYDVQLYAKDIGAKFDQKCREKTCTILDISPFVYTLTVMKDGYEIIAETLDLKGAVSVKKEIRLKKKISLQDVEKKEVTKEEKIDLIKLKGKSVFSKKLDGVGIMYFTQNEKLELFLIPEASQEVSVGTFNLVPKEEIAISNIISTPGQVSISLGKENFIYDTHSDTLASVDIRVPVIYAKYDIFSQKYQMVTKNGTFLVDKGTSQVNFTPIFYDYVAVSENTIIGLVRQTDSEQRKNFGLSGAEYDNGSVLLKYSQDTHEKEILFSAPKKIEKLYQKEGKVFVEDRDGAVFEVSGVSVEPIKKPQ